MTKEIPLTEKQVKLFDSLKKEAQQKADAVNSEYQTKLILTAQGIIAGQDDIAEDAQFNLESFDSGKLVITIK